MGAIAFGRRTHGVAMFLAPLAGLLVAVLYAVSAAALAVSNLPPRGQV